MLEKIIEICREALEFEGYEITFLRDDGFNVREKCGRKEIRVDLFEEDN